MPEIKHAVRRGTHESGSVYDVGLALDQRTEEPRIFGRIVFQICVLDDHEVARRFLDAAAKGRTFPHILRLKKNPHLGIALPQPRQNFAGAVLRTVVHANQFDVER